VERKVTNELSTRVLGGFKKKLGLMNELKVGDRRVFICDL